MMFLKDKVVLNRIKKCSTKSFVVSKEKKMSYILNYQFIALNSHYKFIVFVFCVQVDQSHAHRNNVFVLILKML